MRVHDDWATAGFDAPPVAPWTGPFVGRDLLRSWWEHRAPAGGAVALVESDDGLLPLVAGPEGIAFLGEADLFDYHSPLGSGIPELVAEFVAGQPPGTRLVFDSLPWEAADLIRKGCAEVGLTVAVTEPSNLFLIDEISALAQTEVQIVATSRTSESTG